MIYKSKKNNFLKIMSMDLSLTGSAIFTGYLNMDNSIIQELKALVYYDNKKWFKNKKQNLNIKSIYYKVKSPVTYNKKLQRLKILYTEITSFIKQCNPDYIALEGYAYAAKGAVIDIAEFIGSIKNYIYSHKYKLRIYQPQEPKMFITDKGNADKEQMLNMVKEKFGIDFSKFGIEVKKKTFSGPGFDLTDAYSILQLLKTELLLRYGKLDKDQLTLKQIEVFNRVTKKKKVNLLVEQFIYEKEED